MVFYSQCICYFWCSVWRDDKINCKVVVKLGKEVPTQICWRWSHGVKWRVFAQIEFWMSYSFNPTGHGLIWSNKSWLYSSLLLFTRFQVKFPSGLFSLCSLGLLFVFLLSNLMQRPPHTPLYILGFLLLDYWTKDYWNEIWWWIWFTSSWLQLIIGVDSMSVTTLQWLR